MTKVYFVRHMHPKHAWEDDRTRPLTEEGKIEKVEWKGIRNRQYERKNKNMDFESGTDIQ